MINIGHISFLYLFVTCLTQLKPHRNLTIPANTFSMIYSNDQQYLIAASISEVSVFYGMNGSHIGNLQLEGDDSVSAISVSPTNKMIAVGFKEGKIKLYDLDQSLGLKIVFEAPLNSQINSLCFTKNDEYIVAGFMDDLISFQKTTNNETFTLDFRNQRVFATCCSPTKPGIFIAGGGEGTLAKFSSYRIDNQQATQIVDFSDESDRTVLGCTFSQNGENVYRVGDNGIIYSYHMKSDTEYDILPEIDTESSGTLFQIVASSDQNLLATVNDTHAIIVNMKDNNFAFSLQYQTTNSKTVALGPRSSNIAVVGPDGTANILGECEEKQFYDEKGNCSACLAECKLCQVKNNTCYQCVIDHYLDNTSCLSCGVGCLECMEKDNCQNCDESNHFKKDNKGNCECIDTYYPTNQTCRLCSDVLIGCISCVNAKICDICNNSLHRIKSLNSSCVCQSGYFQDNQKLCQACVISHCLQCSSLNVCTVCDSAKNWVLNETHGCSCRQGYRQNENQCVKCSRGCDKCNSQSCLICNKKTHYNPTPNEKGQCDCAIGYFDNQQKQTCDQCIIGCLNCKNATTCAQCNSTANFILNNDLKCVCKSKQYYLYNSQCVQCAKTIKYCLQCQSFSNCTKCAGTLAFIDSKCQCKQKQFIDKQLNCKPCPEECSTCDSEEICTNCQDGYSIVNRQCVNEGLATFVIFLIVLGVIILAIFVIFMVRCIKGRKRNAAYASLD